jgi:hypothetical protein
MREPRELPVHLLDGRLAPSRETDDASVAARIARVGQLADRGNHDAAAREAAELIETGYRDVRLIGFYLFGMFLQRGVAYLPALLERAATLVTEDLAALGPSRRKVAVVGSATAWLLEHVAARLQFHTRQRDATWDAWRAASDVALVDAILAGSDKLARALEEVSEAPRAAAPLARVRRWTSEELRRAVTRREASATEAPMVATAGPPTMATTGAPMRSPARDEATADDERHDNDALDRDALDDDPLVRDALDDGSSDESLDDDARDDDALDDDALDDDALDGDPFDRDVLDDESSDESLDDDAFENDALENDAFESRSTHARPRPRSADPASTPTRPRPRSADPAPTYTRTHPRSADRLPGPARRRSRSSSDDASGRRFDAPARNRNSSRDPDPVHGLPGQRRERWRDLLRDAPASAAPSPARNGAARRNGSDDDVVAVISPALSALQTKLLGFQHLVVRGELAKAAVVASDVRAILAGFDPVAFFPSLFAAYFKALHQVIDDLAPYFEGADLPWWHALDSYYRADMRTFFED